MIPALSASVSALQSSSFRMAVSAHDTANINTPEFSQRNVVQAEMKPGVRVAALTQTPVPAGSNLSTTDLAEEATQWILAEKDMAANAATIRTQDKMLGTLLDLKA